MEATAGTVISFNHTVSVKLDDSNFLLWRQQVLASKKGHNLLKYIKGKKEVPPRFLSVEDEATEIVKPMFIEWEKQDQLLLSWMLLLMSDLILMRMVGCKMSFQV